MSRNGNRAGSLKTKSNGNGDLEGSHNEAGNKRQRAFKDSLFYYLEEIAKIPTLNANAETELGCLIWQAREILAASEQYGFDPPEGVESFMQEAREVMVTSNLRLVVHIASKFQYFNRHLHLLDFIQMGNIGLMKAVDGFDYRRGTKFSTYATPKIKQPIIFALAKFREIKIPAHIDGLKRRIEKFAGDYEEFHKCYPTVREIAINLGNSMETIEDCLERNNWQFISLEGNAGDPEDDHERLFANVVADDDAGSPEDLSYENHRREKINEILSGMPQIERDTLLGRMGFQGGEKSLEDIAKVEKKTREGIRQIQKRALDRIRQPHRAAKLQQFYEEL